MPKTAPPNHIGDNIRAVREAKHMTQLALGHALGWAGPDAGSQISRFETGQKEPLISTLQRIAEVLGVTIDKLLKQPKQ